MFFLSLGKEVSWWPRAESNHRHADFQSAALPTELLGHLSHTPTPRAQWKALDYTEKKKPPQAVAKGDMLLSKEGDARQISTHPNEHIPILFRSPDAKLADAQLSHIYCYF